MFKAILECRYYHAFIPKTLQSILKNGCLVFQPKCKQSQLRWILTTMKEVKQIEAENYVLSQFEVQKLNQPVYCLACTLYCRILCRLEDPSCALFCLVLGCRDNYHLATALHSSYNHLCIHPVWEGLVLTLLQRR